MALTKLSSSSSITTALSLAKKGPVESKLGLPYAQAAAAVSCTSSPDFIWRTAASMHGRTPAAPPSLCIKVRGRSMGTSSRTSPSVRHDGEPPPSPWAVEARRRTV